MNQISLHRMAKIIIQEKTPDPYSRTEQPERLELSQFD